MLASVRLRWLAPVLISCLSGSLATSVGAVDAPVHETEALVERATELELHRHREWLRLLHFHPLKRWPGRRRSHVSDDRFFLSGNGRHDAAAELEASVRTLLRAASTEIGDEHPQCRFVERARWLRDQLSLPEEAVPDACKAYHGWRDTLNASSITLVFPAAYLNSPSSMFGHTLLRLDPANLDEDSAWLSWSLNFAADTGSDSASSPGYAIKGITGAYPGKFHIIPYFQKLQEYGAIENRDIWEYRLNLDATEVERLMRHAWELRDIEFAYFFFRENCSFRLLELIDYARPALSLAEQFDFTAIPGDTVKAVVDADLVDEVSYRPSVGTQLHHAIEDVHAEQRHWLEALVEAPELADSDSFAELETPVQSQLVRTANQLLTYRSRKNEMSEAMTQRRFGMLQQLARYSTPASSRITVPTPARPDRGHDSVLVSFGPGRYDDQVFSEASLRLSYHDLLDRGQGYPRGAGIALGGITVRSDEQDEARVQSVDIVALRSVSDRLPIFRTLSWGLDVGLDRDARLEDDRLALLLQGHIGRSRPLVRNALIYGFFSPSLRAFRGAGETLYTNAKARVGVLSHGRFGSSELELSVESMQRNPARLEVGFRHNLALARNHALRFEWARSRMADEAINRGQVSYRFYF